MRYNVNDIRNAFPRWPSELDVAKDWRSWALMAQEFFCAAQVLDEKRNRPEGGHVGEQVTEDYLRSLNLTTPAFFCMAFSLELATKAVMVRKLGGEGIKHGKELPFAGHKLADLARQLGIQFSDDELSCLQQATDVIMIGKYPSAKKPDETQTHLVPPNYRDFMETAKQIYEKLIAFVMDGGQSVPTDKG